MGTRSAVAALVLCSGIASGQVCENRWAAPESGLTAARMPGFVQAIKSFGGEIFVGGQFFASGGTPLGYVARWDGTQWLAAGELPGLVYDLETFGAGTNARLYAAGSFFGPGGTTDAGVRRWNGAGWESVGGPNGSVTDLHVHADASGTFLYATGNFTTTGAVATSRIARFDGTQWSAVGATNGLQNITPNTMASVASGVRAGLNVGGYPLSSTQNIARYNGSTWTSENVGGGFVEVTKLATLGTDIYSALSFSQGLYRATGSGGWSSVPVFPPNGYGGSVYTLHRHTDASGTALYAGGDFQTFGGLDSSPAGLGAFNGTSWRVIRPNGWQANPFSRAGAIRALGSLSDGRLVIGGEFDGVRQTASFVGQPLPPPTILMNSIGTWDGAAFAALGEGVTSPGVRAVHRRVVNGSEQVFVGGAFRSVGAEPFAYFAKFENGAWTQPIAELNGAVKQILPYQGGLVLVGDFTHVGATAVQGIVRIDASGAVVPLPFLSQRVSAAAVGMIQGTEILFVGTTGTGASLLRLQNGSWMTTISIGSSVVDVAVAPDGSGAVASFQGTGGGRVFRWNGTTQQEIFFPGASPTVTQHRKLVFVPGSPATLYSVGFFFASNRQGNLARADANGFTLLNTETFNILDVEVFDDGNGPRLLGLTRAVLPTGVASVVRWNGTTWESMGEFNGPVYAAAPYDVGGTSRLLVGGDFTRVGSETVGGLAVYEVCPFCAADVNRDARVDSDDVIEFFGIWDTSDARVDFDASGGVDGDDIVVFFDRWDSGC